MVLRCLFSLLVAGLGSAATMFGVRPLAAQQAPAGPQTAPTPPMASYRPPALALVQPAAGGSVPQDRPVVVFRFTQESGEAIDLGSFAVAVDGVDRTQRFQVTPTEAWGPLAALGDSRAVGPHTLAARVCSLRGACSEITAVVTVATSSSANAEGSDERRRSVVELLLDAARKLLRP
jgi:hypothetical protein